MQTIRLETLGDLIDRVTPAEPDPRTGRRRPGGVYRGDGDARLPLLTSLDLLGGVDHAHEKRGLEEHILRNFIRYSRPYVTLPPDNDWELAILAQHHGVPTRLLDWTYSPLVAAHFATVSGPPGADRVVWQLDWKRIHRAFGFPELALLIQDLAHLWEREHSIEFTPWRLIAGANQRPFVCMIEPPSLDARITAQAAVFTLCSDTTRSLDAFLDAHDLGDTLTKFVIPGDAVSRFRDQLDLASVDERRLFPDLDGVAEFIRRYYS